jgi:hypothetical protein
VFGEFAGLVGVTGCPGAVGCSKRHGGVGSSFELFGYFPITQVYSKSLKDFWRKSQNYRQALCKKLQFLTPMYVL